jgi:tyrosine-protein kinase Etk/Wzc
MNALLKEARKDLQLLQQAAAARESELSRRIEQINRENLKLPEKGLVLVRLQREVDLQQSLYSQLKAKYQEVLIQESGKVEEVAVVKPATEPAAPFNVPSKTMIVLTGIVMGLILGVVLVFLTELFDTSMGTIEDVEELLQVPVLGVIPQLGGEGKKKARAERTESGPSRARDLVTHYDPKSQAAESFRALRTNLQFLRLELKGKLFLITSSFVQEGKTLNAVNLALSMAQAGHRVLLVDADLRKPSVHRVFGLGREPGVTDYVLGNYSWQEVVGTISDVMLGDFSIEDILRTPGMDNLHVLTAGTKPPNPTEILSSERFRQFLAEARQSYDYVFIDTPPILPVADAAEISSLVDGVLLVYTVGRIGRGVLKRAKSNLDNVEARVLGVVLNNVKPEAGPDYFRYHSHYYYGPDTPPGGRPVEAPASAGRAWARPLAQASGVLLVVLVLSAFTLGVFWQDMPEFVPDWLLPYARTLFSN